MKKETKILFNAECPVCNFEISHYADYSKSNSLPLRFEDLNQTDLSRWGLSEDKAARRLYVSKDGELYDGIPAFLILWAEMPRYRLVGKVVALPVVRQIITFLYDYVMAPAIYTWHKRRKAKLRNAPESR